MFDPDIQFATQTDTSQLLAEIGIDPAVVCEVIADDRAMRCPDRTRCCAAGRPPSATPPCPSRMSCTTRRRPAEWSGGGLLEDEP